MIIENMSLHYVSIRLMKLLIIFLSYANASSQELDSPLYEFRGVWIATVANIDWPSKPGLSTQDQKRELLWILDEHQRMGLNAIIFQGDRQQMLFLRKAKNPGVIILPANK